MAMKVLVTHCTRNTGLTALRALSRAGCEVCGADDRRLPFGLKSRYATGAYAMLPREDEPQFSAAMFGLLERVRPDVLIPFHGTEFACRNKTAILQRTHALVSELAAFEVLHDKSELLKLCGRLGVPAPRALSPDEAVAQLRENDTVPVVVKPSRDVGGGAGVSFVCDPLRLVPAQTAVALRYGKALVTEYIPGPTSNIRALHLLFDNDTRLVAHFVLQKHRLWPTRVGATVAGISTHEPWLISQILPIFQALGWRGPADAELKIDTRDGQAKILEINPRFSGILHFPIQCGVNFPLLYCRAALGERLAETLQPRYKAGVRYMAVPKWLRAVAVEVWAPNAKRWQVLRQAIASDLRAPRVRSVHELADPAPLIGRALLALQGLRGVRH
jgi:predicted ATP-grasp superfamily ATP-dependent carboligase